MRSIHRHLGVVLCTVVGGLFLLTGVAVFVAMRHLLLSQFDETLTAKARAIITASEIDDGEFEIDLTVQDFAGFGSGGNDYFEIRRLSGVSFLRSPSLDVHPAGLWSAQNHPSPSDDRGMIRGGWFTDGRSARFYTQRFYPKDDGEMKHQDLYVVVASPDAAMRAQLAGLAIVLAVAGVSALLLMVPAIRAGLSRGLKPLDRLAADVVEIRPGNLHSRLTIDSYPEELAPVVSRLNEWIGTLDASFERERRFSAHAAHELRTPLAELRMIADLSANWPEEATPERSAEMLEVIEELEVLLEKLSLLARAESGRHVVEAEELDPTRSIQNAIARYQANAERRSIHISHEIAEGIICTDPVLWNAIIQNLISNAVAHAPEGAPVCVRMFPGLFEVSNPAPGLAADDLSRMFEPFWRVDHARTTREHSGLGLAIVKACACLLGAECFSRLDDDGLTVGVRWG
jgi:signal transduction histidine kinase